MTRKWCRDCGKYHYAQAAPVQPRGRMEWFDWSFAIVGGVYFALIAWVVHV